MRHIVIIPLLALVGCVLPPPPLYVPPASLAPGFAATLAGSSIQIGGPYPENILVTVTSIDSAVTTGDQLRRVAITPGPHNVTFTASVTFPPTAQASGTLTANAVFAPGQTYYLRSGAVIPGTYNEPPHITAWLADSSGNAVTSTGALYLTPLGQVQTSGPGYDQPAPIYLPDDGGDHRHDHDDDHQSEQRQPDHNDDHYSPPPPPPPAPSPPPSMPHGFFGNLKN
jgi:hypothetical protein